MLRLYSPIRLYNVPNSYVLHGSRVQVCAWKNSSDSAGPSSSYSTPLMPCFGIWGFRAIRSSKISSALVYNPSSRHKMAHSNTWGQRWDEPCSVSSRHFCGNDTKPVRSLWLQYKFLPIQAVPPHVWVQFVWYRGSVFSFILFFRHIEQCKIKPRINIAFIFVEGFVIKKLCLFSTPSFPQLHHDKTMFVHVLAL